MGEGLTRFNPKLIMGKGKLADLEVLALQGNAGLKDSCFGFNLLMGASPRKINSPQTATVIGGEGVR